MIHRPVGDSHMGIIFFFEEFVIAIPVRSDLPAKALIQHQPEEGQQEAEGNIFPSPVLACAVERCQKKRKGGESK